MVRGFTPLIGLAVVMALALAAVFGSMSLANPAQAAIGQPADAELTERAFAPATPTGLKAMMTENGGDVVITWTGLTGDVAVDAATHYDLRRKLTASPNEDSNWTAWTPTAVSTGAMTVTGLTELNGTSLDFQVREVVAGTPGVPSAILSVTPSAPPAAPSNLTAKQSNGMVTLEWVAASTGTSGMVTKWQYTEDNTATPVVWKDVPGGVSGQLAESRMVPLASGMAYNELNVRGVSYYTTGTAATAVPIDGTDDTVLKPAKPVVKATMMNGDVKLSWTAPSDAGRYKYQYQMKSGDGDYGNAMDIVATASTAANGKRLTARASMATVTDLMEDVEYTFQVRAVSTDNQDAVNYSVDDETIDNAGDPTGTPSIAAGVDTEGDWSDEVPLTIEPPAPFMPSFKADDLEPGKNSWYTLDFSINADFNGGLYDMIIKLEEFGVPSSIDNSQIAIEATEGSNRYTFNPAAVGIDGKNIIITFPDVLPATDAIKKDFDSGTEFRVIIRQGANVTNPTASRVYGGNGDGGSTRGSAHEDREIFVEFPDSGVSKVWLAARDVTDGTGVNVPRVVQLDEEDGGLGDTLTATGLGFENGGTMHFFLDRHLDANGKVVGPNGMLDSGEDVLCSVDSVSGNQGSCEFEVSTPTFQRGINYVNAVDGDGKTASDPEGGDNDFELKASIKATPAGGSPGEIMQVQLVSFPGGAGISQVKLSGSYICGGIPPGMTSHVSCGSLGFGSVGSQGTASIGVSVPNWAISGVQELFVKAGSEDDDYKVTIAGPRIVPTPQTVVANQRVSLIGTGFSPRSEIGEAASNDPQVARVSIGGDDIDWSRINNGRDVEVDDGGNWSASVDLPLSEATTGEGERTIRITDSMGRTGSVDVTLAERDFDVTPPEGRVGTLAVVRGTGYPSKNDEGSSFTVDVIYNVQEGTSTRVSVVPDASGRFEVQLRIPTTASIPSTNQVEVKFELADGTEVLENKQHIVPEGIITLSETSGGPGSTVTVSGEGYKGFVNVDAVSIGTFDVTPSPKPHTDGNGMMSFDILVPGIDVGIQTIEVHVGGTTSSVGFTVTESGINPGDIVEVAKGVEDLGDNLDVIWHFNNDSKDWTFYDGEEGSTLTHVITGETYLILVKSTVEVILNRDTRSLTCANGNCWNQIVW